MAVIIGTNTGDIINEASASPGVIGGPATTEDDQIATGNGDDRVVAGGGNDAVFGGNGNDDLDGSAGNDLLSGGRGDDRLHGGFGADILVGGRGADSFEFGTGVTARGAFGTVIDTGIGEGARDVIVDFRQGEDVIDLGPVNLYESLPILGPVTVTNVVFEFIGTEAFSPGGGRAQLRYEVVGGSTILQGDGLTTPGQRQPPPDGFTDFEIELLGVFALTERDIIL